jgi:hypothetical protein
MKHSDIVGMLFDKTSVITFGIKVIRLVVCVVILNYMGILFKKMYTYNQDNNKVLPSYRYFLGTFFIVEFAVNMIISLLLVLFATDDVAKASSIDYIIALLVSMKLSYTGASIIIKRFDYEGDGINVINAIEEQTMSIIVLNLFIPYYLMVRHIIY